MPIPTPVFNPQDPAYSIIDAARFRLHEKMPSLLPYSGTILRETEASTQQAFNNAWRKLQATMANAGSSTFEASIVIQGIPPVSPSALDPATECGISWAGCSDGATQYTTPALPSNLMTPLWMSERWSGSMQPFPSPQRPNMIGRPDGLDKFTKTNYNRVWQWRGEVIYYPGSLQTEDFWIYYQSYFPDIVDVSTTPWFMQNVPIIRCQEALSHWLCREFCMSQAQDDSLDPDVRQQFMAAMPYFEAQAMAATRLLISPDKKRKQRMGYSRRPFAGGGGGVGGGMIGSGGIPAWTGG